MMKWDAACRLYTSNRAYSGEKLEVEEYTSYDLALDNRDALASDAYKNAENYYKSVFENAEIGRAHV